MKTWSVKIYFLVLLSCISCNKDEESPSVDFRWENLSEITTIDNCSSSNNGAVGLEVSFINQSENGIAYEWDFGDGQVKDSSNYHFSPKHFYTTGGNVTVTLTVKGNFEVAKISKILHLPDLTPDFTFKKAYNDTLNIYKFCINRDQLFGEVACLWDFGDGDTSTLPNPTHCFHETGSHLVSLILTRGDELSQITKTVQLAPLTVDFSYEKDDIMLDSVHFSDLSKNVILNDSTVVRWDFGDGEDSVYVIPHDHESLTDIGHQYPGGGVYMSTLEIIQGNEHKFLTKAVSVPVFNPEIEVIPLTDTVRHLGFKIMNANNLINARVIWNFGDGSSEITYDVKDSKDDRIIRHHFDDQVEHDKKYTVSLTIGQGADVKTAEKIVTIPAIVPIISASSTINIAPAEITFSADQSLYIPNGATYNWRINNGNNNPRYTVVSGGLNNSVITLRFTEVDKEYKVELRYKYPNESDKKTSVFYNLNPLTANFEMTNYNWNGSDANITFNFIDLEPRESDGATFSWTLSGDASENSTSETFLVNGLANGNYTIDCSRMYNGVTETQSRDFTISDGDFSWN